MMKPLFAHGAANGKSPWFLLHHSRVEMKTKRFDANWWNTITRDTVFEEWKETTDVFYHDFTDRITFAKNKHGYVYIGTFRSSEQDLFCEFDPVLKRNIYIKRYHLVENDYEG